MSNQKASARMTFSYCLLLGCLCHVLPVAAQSGASQPGAATAQAPAASAQPEPVEHMGPRTGVSAPVVLDAPNPQYSKEARAGKVSGNVLVYLQVGTDGVPDHLRVIRGIGYGLDEKAIEAVKQYKFKPAMKNGVPVRTELNVEVNFQIMDKPPRTS